MKQSFKLGMACIVVCFSTGQVWAGAFANEDLTAGAAGAANAVVASADDLAAAIYNPSGLAWQEGVQAMIGNQSRYRTLSGEINANSYGGSAGLSDLNLVAVSWLPQGSSWGVSGSIVTPYAYRTNWTTAPFPSALSETDVNMQRYSLDTFLRLNNTLAVSLGVDSYDSRIVLNSSGSSFAGSGWSDAGMHAGMRWEFSPFWVFGAHLRQGAKVNVSDSIGANMDMNLPDELSMGIAHALMNDELRLELDMKYSKWSTLADMNVKNNGVYSQSVPINFKATTDVALGATWFWRHDTQLRLGYAYEQGANKLAGYQPAIADQTGHRISVGFGGMMSGMHLDMAWAGVFYPDANAGGAYAAAYSDARYSFMFSLTKKF